MTREEEMIRESQKRYDDVAFLDGVKWADEHPYWRPSTEHPQMDEEVIALVGEYNQIYFAHIVDKRFCVDYDGWNIPDVRWWIPCPKIEEEL